MAPNAGARIVPFGLGLLIGSVGKAVADRIYGVTRGVEKDSKTLLNIDYGIPKSPTVLFNESYTVRYNAARKIPEWVLQVLSKDRLKGNARRETCFFREDPRIPKIFSSSNDDYHKSGFTRGHMASAGMRIQTASKLSLLYFILNPVCSVPLIF